MASLSRTILLVLLLAACGEPAEETPNCAGGNDGEVNWQPAFDASDMGAFYSVWGGCHDDVWAVGGQPDEGVAMRFDGSGWASVEPPAGPVIHWVHGVGETKLLVGDGGRALRYDGGTFETLDSGVEVPLWGAYLFAEDDAWAVGGDPTSPSDGGVILHWDGTGWTPTATDAVMFKIWGPRPDFLFAIGVGGAILHWDGSSWTAMESGTQEDLISLWGRADDDIVAIGGRGVGVGVRWDGSGWTPFELLTPGMSGGWMAGDGVVTAGGSRGTLARIEGTDVEIEDTGTMHLLHGVYGFDGGPRFAVGGSLTRQPPWEGVVLIDP